MAKLMDKNLIHYHEKDKAIIHNHNLSMKEANEKLNGYAYGSTYTAGDRVVIRVEENLFKYEFNIINPDIMRKATCIADNRGITIEILNGLIQDGATLNVYERKMLCDILEKIAIDEEKDVAGLIKIKNEGNNIYSCKSNDGSTCFYHIYEYETSPVQFDPQGNPIISRDKTYKVKNVGLLFAAKESKAIYSLNKDACNMISEKLKNVGNGEQPEEYGIIVTKIDDDLFSYETEEGVICVCNKDGLIFEKIGNKLNESYPLDCEKICELLKNSSEGELKAIANVEFTKISENLFSYETEEGVTCYCNEQGLLLRAKGNEVLINAYYNGDNYATVLEKVPKLKLPETMSTKAQQVEDEDDAFPFSSSSPCLKWLTENPRAKDMRNEASTTTTDQPEEPATVATPTEDLNHEETKTPVNESSTTTTTTIPATAIVPDEGNDMTAEQNPLVSKPTDAPNAKRSSTTETATPLFQRLKPNLLQNLRQISSWQL